VATRLLVTGASGALGHVVCEQAAAAGMPVTGTHLLSPVRSSGTTAVRLDVRDVEAVRRVFADARPHVVVHTAYRQDDRATTSGGAAAVAMAAQETGARMVLVSSDVVFPGGPDAFDEDAEPAPVTDYGRAKLAAEQAVAELVTDSVVVRTSLVLGASGGRRSPMEGYVHELAAGRADGVLFTDDVRCPVHIDDLAAALLELATGTGRGVRHCAGPDALSRHEIGLLVAQRDGLDPGALRPGTRAGTVDGPLELRLDSRRTQSGLATRLRGAREFLRG
jgi:dTDP-4-dehydrorhamnose reductase